MDNFTPFWQQNTHVEAPVEANQDNSIGVDFSFFSCDEAKKISTGMAEEETSTKKKRSPKKVTESDMPDGLVNPIPGANVAEVDYARSYSEPNNLIRGAIVQIDELSGAIKQDIDDIRASKTIKNKYTYLTNLTASASALIGTKISAIKELTSTTTQIHKLEMDRMKALKLDKAEGNDEMRMMDIYSAFVNTPMGTYNAPAPNIQDLTLGVNNPAAGVGGIEMVNLGAQQSPLTPEQNRMRMESNPNIQVVVRYDQTTGQRCFDVIDTTNGMSIPNYPRPDNFLLEDTTIDVHAQIARNRNVNTVWPLVLDGSNQMIVNEY